MPHAWEHRWTTGKRLGQGGQGVTFDVTIVDDPSVRGALKHLRNNQDPQARGRMRREVASLQTLASGGGAVPRVLDHNTDCFEDLNIELYVVMELIPGPTLREFVDRSHPIGIDQAASLVLALCKTVALAHTHPILHRDLKPENIIVRDAGTFDLVVVDYGLSFNATDEALTETDETFRNKFLDLPETNTPGGDRRDPRSDLTALCAVLFFCLTDKVPGQLQDANGALPHRRSGCLLRDIYEDERVERIDEFFTRGFAPNIANRFQRIDDVSSRLEELLARKGSVNESDPIQLAAALSLELRARDRETQLAEFRGHSGTLFAYLIREGGKYLHKLGRFELTAQPAGFQRQSELPVGLDFVAACPHAFVLSTAHHPFQRHRLYVVASRGEQCVLLAADSSLRSDQPNARPHAVPIKWEEVARYEGEPDPVFPLASDSLRDWLTAQLKELRSDILGEGDD